MTLLPRDQCKWFLQPNLLNEQLNHNYVYRSFPPFLGNQVKEIKCSLKPGMSAEALIMDIMCILEGKLHLPRSSP